MVYMLVNTWFMWAQKEIYIYTILQFPGSIYAIETRNPGPMYENKFFQLFLYKKKKKKKHKWHWINQSSIKFNTIYKSSCLIIKQEMHKNRPSKREEKVEKYVSWHNSCKSESQWHLRHILLKPRVYGT